MRTSLDYDCDCDCDCVMAIGYGIEGMMEIEETAGGRRQVAEPSGSAGHVTDGKTP